MSQDSQAFGLYIHIPFCRYICHYCDFAKTANYKNEHVEAYLKRLYQQLEWFFGPGGPYESVKVSSVFFGGGTPGLLSAEYANIMRLLEASLKEGAEVSLETNPEDISSDKLETWKSLGFNRISMGVQTFSEEGLKLLTRRHGSVRAREAIKEILAHFDNLNIDLIYGWQNQTLKDWKEDLRVANELGVPHLSLYSLTYESGTVLTRKKDRGVIREMEDAHLASLYETARDYLQESWDHDEVSNWSRDGYSCRHNWIYWQDQPYLAVGCGAHGYLPVGDFGLRYEFPKQLQSYLRPEFPSKDLSINGFLTAQGAILDEDRAAQDWLFETVGCGLRSRKGVNISRIKKLLNCKFVPGKILQTGIDMGLVYVEGDWLFLKPEEWFRETSWALELTEAFRPQN